VKTAEITITTPRIVRLR